MLCILLVLVSLHSSLLLLSTMYCTYRTTTLGADKMDCLWQRIHFHHSRLNEQTGRVKKTR